MGPRPGLPENQCHDAIGRLTAGASIRQVAHHFDVRYTQ